MMKPTFASALVALLFSIATTQAAVVPLETRDLNGQWNALLSVSKNSELKVKDLCRGVLTPVTITETVTLAPTSTITSTATRDVIVPVTKEITELTTTQTTTVKETATTATDTVLTTSTKLVTVIGAKPTDEILAKRDTTTVARTKFDALYRAAPDFVLEKCRGVVAPNTVNTVTTVYSANPTTTITVENPISVTTTKTIPSTVVDVVTKVNVAVETQSLVVSQVVTATVYEAPPRPRFSTYRNPLSGLDAVSVAKFPGWDGVVSGIDGMVDWNASDSGCVEFCSNNSGHTGSQPACGFVFYSSHRYPINCYAKQRFGISQPFRAVGGDVASGAAIYYLGTCEDAEAAGAPADAMADCLNSVNWEGWAVPE